jgi:CHAP domain
MRKFATGFGLAAAMLAGLAATPAQAQYWQCVPYARQISGVDIRGNAHTWWGQAEGRYARGNTPKEGAVMAFRSSRAMPLGHVAVVSRIVSDREVLLDHANWSRGGRIERGVRAVDVSANGDWSSVKVWFAPIGDMGLRVNPVAGFIYPDTAPSAFDAKPQFARRGPLIGQDVLQLAALEAASGR